MFDENWMTGKENKPIDSVEDALMALSANLHCSGVSCKECAMHMYDKTDGRCGQTRNNATKFLVNELLGDLELGGAKGVERQQIIYEHLFDRFGGLAFKKRDEPQDDVPRDGTCATCVRSKMHTSGIYWCESFGFCYRFDDGKMDE